MNPLALFLLAAAAGGLRMPGGFDRGPAEDKAGYPGKPAAGRCKYTGKSK